MNDVMTPATLCLHCGYLLNKTANPFSDALPAEGDFTMCVGCGNFLVFGKDLKLRLPSSLEASEIEASPNARELKKAWKRNELERRTRDEKKGLQ